MQRVALLTEGTLGCGHTLGQCPALSGATGLLGKSPGWSQSAQDWRTRLRKPPLISWHCRRPGSYQLEEVLSSGVSQAGSCLAGFKLDFFLLPLSPAALAGCGVFPNEGFDAKAWAAPSCWVPADSGLPRAVGSFPAGPLFQAGAPEATLHPWNSCPALDSPSQYSGPQYRHLLTHLYLQQDLLVIKIQTGLRIPGLLSPDLRHH